MEITTCFEELYGSMELTKENQNFSPDFVVEYPNKNDCKKSRHYIGFNIRAIEANQVLKIYSST